jgi:hypothetical protein
MGFSVFLLLFALARLAAVPSLLLRLLMNPRHIHTSTQNGLLPLLPLSSLLVLQFLIG